MNETANFLYFFVAVIILILITCYAILAVFLNNFNKKVYGTSTVMAWIPFANIYLLGKLTFNKDVGYGLIALFLLSGTLKMTFDKISVTLSLPNVLQITLGAIFAGTFIATLIYGVQKYSDLENKKNTKNSKSKQ